MKKLLLMVGLLVPIMAFSQSNTQGTISLGLGWGVTLGGASITSTFQTDTSNGNNFLGGESKGSGVGAKANYGVKMQYGFADQFSAGIYIRREAAVYATTFDDADASGNYFPSTDITTSGLSLGVEAKYYVLNKDHINITLGASIGYSTGKATLDYANVDGNLHGLNYGLGAGFNFYFGSHIGLGIDLAYSGQSLSGEPDDINEFALLGEYTTTKYKVSGGGVYFGLNFLAKFGGQ